MALLEAMAHPFCNQSAALQHRSYGVTCQFEWSTTSTHTFVGLTKVRQSCCSSIPFDGAPITTLYMGRHPPNEVCGVSLVEIIRPMASAPAEAGRGAGAVPAAQRHGGDRQAR